MKAKIKTNLTHSELAVVGEHLQDLVKSQHIHDYVPENGAEKELLRRADTAFTEFLTSLSNGFMEIVE